ncbi:MAG: amidohydrolase family protein [Acidimicrobiales bacterium]|nr:amidohydrolase family protein [Acidimicrobiales bacterium]
MIFDFQTFLPAQFNGSPFGTDDLLYLADEAAVDRMVVMPAITSRPDNASLAASIRSTDRLVGCAAVNPASGQAAVDVLEESIQLGLRGLRLSPATHQFEIDDATVDPLMEIARRQNVPVTTESCSHHCSPVQVANLADRFPDVNIIADVGFRPVAPPVSLGQPEPPAGRIADQALDRPNLFLGLTTLATAETYLIKRILDTISVDRLVFGSNAPTGIPCFSIGGVRQANLGEEAEALFLGNTLSGIYNLI